MKDSMHCECLTVKDSYSLPRISDAIDSIGEDSKYFSSLGLAMGYNYVPIVTEDKHKTAFPSRFELFLVHSNALRFDKRSRYVPALDGTCTITHKLEGLSGVHR